MDRPERLAAVPPAPRAGSGEAGTAVSTADRFYAALDARDVEAWLDLLSDDVRLDVDAATTHGRPAARGWVEELLRTSPDVRCHDRRTVVATDDTVVSEFRLRDPRTDGNGPDGVPPGRPEGTVCEIVGVSAGRITSVRRYHAPTDRGGPAGPLRSASPALALHTRRAVASCDTQVLGILLHSPATGSGNPARTHPAARADDPPCGTSGCRRQARLPASPYSVAGRTRTGTSVFARGWATHKMPLLPSWSVITVSDGASLSSTVPPAATAAAIRCSATSGAT